MLLNGLTHFFGERLRLRARGSLFFWLLALFLNALKLPALLIQPELFVVGIRPFVSIDCRYERRPFGGFVSLLKIQVVAATFPMIVCGYDLRLGVNPFPRHDGAKCRHFAAGAPTRLWVVVAPDVLFVPTTHEPFDEISEAWKRLLNRPRRYVAFPVGDDRFSGPVEISLPVKFLSFTLPPRVGTPEAHHQFDLFRSSSASSASTSSISRSRSSCWDRS